ncbi:hypothetical protein MZM54_00980 [[Brevibacterium] frigoritolerans]|nr:hypothetical protein [Peribacillus frigoritolerans]
MLDEIKKDLQKQQKGIQGCTANPSRHLQEKQINWLITQTEKVDKLQNEVEFWKDIAESCECNN